MIGHDTSENGGGDLLRCSADIVAAYVARNATPPETIGALIGSVHSALLGLGREPDQREPDRRKPAVSIARSVQDDHLVCLEDGKKLKMLKRHLKSAFNMTPEQYRERWDLPPSYPMVAANYARQRSSLAKQIGLGTKPGRRRQGSR